ncbi:hypothetical protein ICG_01923 [Bacillus cereus BAG1X1-3]|uniref:hypothetical protein n=1 Tax=Bacillus mycoides TaxID=1405 RepID=UPI00027AA725|nr:hypothetical protein [Bacillus mycoides]EJS58184.1 hypothetical protein ICG_01923 [Bacillus cereus BAG1X1-3]MBG9688797.1 hypothetical protein [Bacillus mycoides]
MNEYIPILSSATTGVIALAGVWLTQRGNKKTLNQQLIRDEKKYKRDEQKEVLEMYNRVIKLDGEYMMHNDVGGPILKFNKKAYNDNFRPIIYEKYHLLDQDMLLIVAEMDERIKMCTYRGEFSDEDNISLNGSYDSLIKGMKKQIASFL